LEVANRVVVMDKGRIEQIGTPGDVYDNPATAFVHGFIGESIVHAGGGCWRLGAARRPAASTSPPMARPLAPQNLFVRRQRHADRAGGNRLAGGAVRHVRSFGPIQRAEIALSGGEGKTVIEIDATRDRELQAGEIIGLQPRRYRIFAAQD